MNKHDIREQKIKWVKNNPDFSAVAKAFGSFDPDKTYGGPDKFGDSLIPDKLCGLDCAGIFYFHDGRFEIGGNHADFKRANKLMLSELNDWIDLYDWWAWGTNWFWRRAAKKAALVYFGAVELGGSFSFNYNKSK